ncbi:coiled-coil domain-containing protein 189 [Cheilinus undulatus]|uniref:coiled-coil domain-containing protein 189 n=1 Tax=Cheilinus undulatus TaxID=241271 RepID=UPI001BD54C94|nr:coiled-coil domain-containing protein 189 [Cheilinus undulatus]
MDSKFKVDVPQGPKAKIMLWTDFSYHDMEQIDTTLSIPDLESALCNVLDVDRLEPKKGVLLELYVHTVLFCRQRSFIREQTSALLSIIKSVHEANIATPLNNIEQSFKYCKELLLCHSVRRPPFSINLFSPDEASCVLKYIYENYVRHYKLYKYIFVPQVKLDLLLNYSVSPNQDEPAVEDFSSVDVENVLEPETGQNTDSSPKIQEANTKDAAFGSKLGLKILIKKEIREQMALVSEKLDQRMKEMAIQHKSAPHSPEPNNKGKK